MTPAEERRLVRRLKARDERAFREFVQAYQNLVFNLVFRLLGSREEAEDVSQEVFVTVFKSIRRFRGDSKLSTWLYRVSANHAKNRLKYLSRRRFDQQDPIHKVAERDLHTSVPRPTQPDKLAIGYELESMVQDALAQLDEDHRLILVLRDVEHLSYEEIGQISEMPMGTVKSRIHRARTALREALQQMEKKGRTP